MRTVARIVFAASLLCASTAAAQSRSSAESVLRVAAEHVLQGSHQAYADIRDLNRAMDPRLALPQAVISNFKLWDRDIEPQTLKVIQSRFPKVTFQKRELVLRCMPTDPECNLTGADAFITFTRPDILGDSARILVEVLRNTNARRTPVQTEIRAIILHQHNGKWRVSADRFRGVS